MNGKVALVALVCSPLVVMIVVFTLILGMGASQSGGNRNDSQPGSEALSDIPSDYLKLYREAAPACPGLDWSILAAIGKIETNHGRLDAPGVHSGENFAGAAGPMQFLQATFDGVVTGVTNRHEWPKGGAIPPNRYNPHDAIYAASYYLCQNGAPKDLRRAIYAYNHADWYVNDVLAQAQRYVAAGGCGQIDGASKAARIAIDFACQQLGLPYVWGGNGKAYGHAGFDCSGLVVEAYKAAGILLPRTTDVQYNAGPQLPASEPLKPGDLVFYGHPGNIHHVGLYLGGGKMIHAPDFGQVVKVADYRWPTDDYYGATRPVDTAIPVGSHATLRSLADFAPKLRRSGSPDGNRQVTAVRVPQPLPEELAAAEESARTVRRIGRKVDETSGKPAVQLMIERTDRREPTIPVAARATSLRLPDFAPNLRRSGSTHENRQAIAVLASQPPRKDLVAAR
ncbi:hypothetical protein D5S17_35780 [Pseudonocardiaceae bacterium YIM PH 21723]|nr:hypothetical protein D5S17_35780 [Pseudonocardiaceae bacterium YIM PH 21723]